MTEQPKTPKTDDVLELQDLGQDDVEGHGNCISLLSVVESQALA